MLEQETWDDLPDPPEDDDTPPAYLRPRDLRDARRISCQRNMMYAPLMGCPPLVTPWLLAMRSHRRIAHEEEAHAEQSITR